MTITIAKCCIGSEKQDVQNGHLPSQQDINLGENTNQFDYALKISPLFLIDAWNLPGDFKDEGHLINHKKELYVN